MTADDVITLETEHGTEYFCSESCKTAYKQHDETQSWTDRLLTKKGWMQAFQNAVGEWAMLWEDIIIGFIIAGLIGAFVPREWWTIMFNIAPEGTLGAVLMSCVIAVVVGVVTFVCSVGNVPFAVILWQNGIPFGGVMSFIFADLIVPNISDAYRRYYGMHMAAILFVSIFVTAVISGVLIHYIWHAAELVPASGALGGTAPEGYTLYLNVLFTPLVGVQLYVASQ